MPFLRWALYLSLDNYLSSVSTSCHALLQKYPGIVAMFYQAFNLNRCSQGWTLSGSHKRNSKLLKMNLWSKYFVCKRSWKMWRETIDTSFSGYRRDSKSQKSTWSKYRVRYSHRPINLNTQYLRHARLSNQNYKTHNTRGQKYYRSSRTSSDN
jgi:hypothetical protein